ncbi:MAG: sugar phosphate nucleotidyltransferase [Cytophagales bacterium]
MRIIIPMAGMGKRMRPHSLFIPKPLIPVAGKPIVQHLVKDIVKICKEDVEEIAFVIGHFGEAVEKQLIGIAESVGAKGSIFYQEEALGTAHAILCAKEALKGHVVVAFADTLFKADFTLDTNQDGIIWVQKVEDPRPFGVVKINDEGYITDFVEKPETFVSDLAIIGIYYFKDGENLRDELQYLIDNNILDKGEFQITNALENMKEKGVKIKPGEVTEWLDCGNYQVTINTNQRYLTYLEERGEKLQSDKAKVKNSVIIPPVLIDDDAEIENSVVGPYVSIGKGTKIKNSRLSNTIIQKDSSIVDGHIADSMIGNNVEFKGDSRSLSLGDFTRLE